MEILKNGKYSCLKRTTDNYFVGDGLGKVDFPMTVRVTAVTGEQKEAVLPSMQNDNNILSNVQFSGFAAGGKCQTNGGFFSSYRKRLYSLQTVLSCAPWY